MRLIDCTVSSRVKAVSVLRMGSQAFQSARPKCQRYNTVDLKRLHNGMQCLSCHVPGSTEISQGVAERLTNDAQTTRRSLHHSLVKQEVQLEVDGQERTSQHRETHR